MIARERPRSKLTRFMEKAEGHIDQKQVTLALRWLLVLIAVGFILSGEEGISVTSRGFVLATVFVLTNVFLSFLPRRLFTRLILTGPMVMTDILIVTTAIYLSGNLRSDLYLLYFLTIFLAALSRNMKVSVLSAIVVILIYGLTTSWRMTNGEFLTTAFLIRIPFFFLSAVFSGFLASQVKRRESEVERTTLFSARLQHELEKARKTEEKAREELLALHRYNENVLESLNTGVLVVDPEGIVTTFNTEATRITGLPDSWVVGKPLSDMPALRAFDALLTRVTREGEICGRGELAVDTERGSSVDVEISTAVLRDTKYRPSGAIATFKDISEIKELERKLKRSERLAMLGEMAACVAHEIRNPLNAISGFAQLLYERSEEGDKCKHFLGIMVKEAKRIENMVRDTLVFSRGASKEHQPVDINQIIETTVEFLSDKAEERGVSVSLGLEQHAPLVSGNQTQLEQIFSNLIINALQATQDGGSIQITTATVGDHVEAKVSDTGPGIPPEKLESIFHPFFTTKEEGTGLGLSVCSKIAEDHGGSIEVESEPGQGATFTVTLPVLSVQQDDSETQDEVATVSGEGGKQ
ncbi:MAG: hypothetical protein AMJ46_03500 [Latescibacteria bacterium DG_63]|nr:MAG: hypothetical protein AMJ46_03500 [Latescibacteria bacterium DG_63]